MINDESDRFNPRDAKDPEAAKGKSAKRREARKLATQALYQWHMAGHSLNEIEAQFRVDNDFSDIDGAYFREILHGVPAMWRWYSAWVASWRAARRFSLFEGLPASAGRSSRGLKRSLSSEIT